MQERSDLILLYQRLFLTKKEVSANTLSMFEIMVSLPRSMASSLVALPRSCHDLGKDAMAMQDRAKANHDLGKDAMVANPFFGNSQCPKPWYPCKIHVPARRFRRYSRFAFRSYSLDFIVLILSYSSRKLTQIKNVPVNCPLEKKLDTFQIFRGFTSKIKYKVQQI